MRDIAAGQCSHGILKGQGCEEESAQKLECFSHSVTEAVKLWEAHTEKFTAEDAELQAAIDKAMKTFRDARTHFEATKELATARDMHVAEVHPVSDEELMQEATPSVASDILHRRSHRSRKSERERDKKKWKCRPHAHVPDRQRQVRFGVRFAPITQVFVGNALEFSMRNFHVPADNLTDWLSDVPWSWKWSTDGSTAEEPPRRCALCCPILPWLALMMKLLLLEMRQRSHLLIAVLGTSPALQVGDEAQDGVTSKRHMMRHLLMLFPHGGKTYVRFLIAQAEVEQLEEGPILYILTWFLHGQTHRQCHLILHQSTEEFSVGVFTPLFHGWRHNAYGQMAWAVRAPISVGTITTGLHLQRQCDHPGRVCVVQMRAQHLLEEDPAFALHDYDNVVIDVDHPAFRPSVDEQDSVSFLAAGVRDPNLQPIAQPVIDNADAVQQDDGAFDVDVKTAVQRRKMAMIQVPPMTELGCDPREIWRSTSWLYAQVGSHGVEFHPHRPSVFVEFVRAVYIVPDMFTRSNLLTFLGLMPYIVPLQALGHIHAENGDFVRVVAPPTPARLNCLPTRPTARMTQLGIPRGGILQYYVKHDFTDDLHDMPTLGPFIDEIRMYQTSMTLRPRVCHRESDLQSSVRNMYEKHLVSDMTLPWASNVICFCVGINLLVLVLADFVLEPDPVDETDHVAAHLIVIQRQFDDARCADLRAGQHYLERGHQIGVEDQALVRDYRGIPSFWRMAVWFKSMLGPIRSLVLVVGSRFQSAVDFEHVPGHSGSGEPGSEMVDLLAGEARDGTELASFAGWLDLYVRNVDEAGWLWALFGQRFAGITDLVFPASAPVPPGNYLLDGELSPLAGTD
eukprot:s279_g28.t1